MAKKVINRKGAKYVTQQGTRVVRQAHQATVEVSEHEKDFSNQAAKGATLGLYAIVDEDTNEPIKDLSGQDLRGKNFSGMDLSEYNLRDSDLTGANLAGAKMGSIDGAKLTKANLRGANFDGLYMFNVNMEGADLTGASFYGSDINAVDASGANFTEANLTARIVGCEFRDATFVRAEFTETEIDMVNFEGSDFSHANLSFGAAATSFRNCNFSSTNIETAAFENFQDDCIEEGKEGNADVIYTCDLRGVNWQDTKMSPQTAFSFVERDMYGNVYVSKAMYDKFDFEEAQKELGVTENQFEFLVLSGVIETRDNITLEPAQGVFDPDRHHIPVWAPARSGIKEPLEK